MSIDDSELRAFSTDLGLVPKNMVNEVVAVLKKGGVNIKTAMQQDLRASKSFKAVARSVDFDVHGSSAFGQSSYSVEIGPNKSRNTAAGLAGIAYFGGVNGGGGTVRDPAEALAEEAQAVEEYLAKIWEGLL